MELSVLAGLPFRCARSEGGEHRGAQACVQRAGLRARNREIRDEQPAEIFFRRLAERFERAQR